mmetsp:Transcript_98063/g.194124  ORF Transcript_98063/g.194124 Transcript_98063/m.194124 type:complete len:977 (+) Transcript_98063:155-3085(+)
MGQAQSEGDYFKEAKVKEHFAVLQTLWTEAEFLVLLDRLKETTLNFSLERAKFLKFLQLAATYEETIALWFRDFSHDRASQVVDGLEFFSMALLISSNVGLSKKLSLLFQLFDMDKTKSIRKDEFTIFLKAVTTGLHRAISGLPPPASVADLGSVSSEFYGTLAEGQGMTENVFFSWITEVHVALNYISVLSKLKRAVFTWGANSRFQLGLNFEPEVVRVGTPVLCMEGLKISTIATGESHTLFLTEEGRVWTCGSGICGLLGHGGTEDSPQPRVVEALAHARITNVAVGVRHSVAVSEKGQVFTWGSADLGQLGHGGLGDRDIHIWAKDPRSGGQFAYVPKPTVVIGLFGKRILVKKAVCCSFATLVLTEQGHVYSWGNTTDGQCGHGQRCSDYALLYLDEHLHRTAMQVLFNPRKIEVGMTFRSLTGGGSHVIAIDRESRVWTWGLGFAGRLGHGDQRTLHEPRLIERLKYQITLDTAAGEAHSLCMTVLYRLTITGSSQSEALSPFSLLGLPLGRSDKDLNARRQVTPPGTQLQFNALACAQLLQIGLPFYHDDVDPIPDSDNLPFKDSVVLIDRSLWPGEWLKLSTTDYDFHVQMSPSGQRLSRRSGLPGRLLYASEGRWEAPDLADRICVFEDLVNSGKTTPNDLTPAILDLARKFKEAKGLACLFILPKKVDIFVVEAPEGTRPLTPFGVVTHEHGMALKKHVKNLLQKQIKDAPGGVPADVADWREKREDYTGKVYYENEKTKARRRSPPQLTPDTQAWLLSISEDAFLQRLQAVLHRQPKAVIITQQSWRPDVELVELPEKLLESLEIPVVMVTFEAGEELKSVLASGSQPWVSMEIQPFGGVYAWGNGTSGQLGLSCIENQNLLAKSENIVTGETTCFASQPSYLAHLHEHQVLNMAGGAAHTAAVTQQGEVFAWGAADGVGVPLDGPTTEVPMFVEQLEGIVKATKAFAGHNHTFVLADMPFQSVV